MDEKSENQSRSIQPQPEPNPFDQSAFPRILDEIREKAAQVNINPFFIDNHMNMMTRIMEILKRISRNILNYKEVRKGFIEVAATILVCINYADQFATLQNPTNNHE